MVTSLDLYIIYSCNIHGFVDHWMETKWLQLWMFHGGLSIHAWVDGTRHKFVQYSVYLGRIDSRLWPAGWLMSQIFYLYTYLLKPFSFCYLSIPKTGFIDMDGKWKWTYMPTLCSSTSSSPQVSPFLSLREQTTIACLSHRPCKCSTPSHYKSSTTVKVSRTSCLPSPSTTFGMLPAPP